MAVTPNDISVLERGIHRLRRNRHQKAMGQKGLCYGQPLTLLIIGDEQPVCQTQLANIMNVTPASVTVSLKRMEKSGWIVKEENPKDKRYSLIRLTPKGEELAAYCRNEMKRLEQRQYMGFTEDELLQLADFYKRMQENLQTLPMQEDEQ